MVKEIHIITVADAFLSIRDENGVPIDLTKKRIYKDTLQDITITTLDFYTATELKLSEKMLKNVDAKNPGK